MTQIHEDMSEAVPEPARVPKLDIVLPPSPDGSSFAVYQAASAAQAQIILPEGADPRDFFVDGATYQLPQATLTRVHSCAQIVRRTQTEIDRDAAPTVQLTLYVAGEGEVCADGRTERARPGDIIILDSRRASETAITAFDLRLVYVPQDRVPPIYLAPGVHTLRLPAEAVGTRLLATMIEALVREVGGLSVAEADHAVIGLCQLGAGVVAAQLARREQDRRRWSDPQLDAAMAYIERRWAEPELTPEAVRVQIGTSRAGLYRLFSPLGGIEAAIRQRRLDHAMRALVTEVSPTFSIGEFAARHGFRNELQCVRAFQARFGATPLQVHARIVSGDRVWLTEQAGRAGLSSTQAWLAALTRGFPEGNGQQQS